MIATPVARVVPGAAGEDVRCPYCAALFPEEWPHDFVLSLNELPPVDAARHVLVFTRILHGTDRTKRHTRCLQGSLDWLVRLREARPQLRVMGIEPQLYDLWRRLRRDAEDAITEELSERASRSAVDGDAVKTAVRAAMTALGWEDFSLEVGDDGNRVRIAYPTAKHELCDRRRGAFITRLHNTLGSDAADHLDLRFRRLTD